MRRCTMRDPRWHVGRAEDILNRVLEGPEERIVDDAAYREAAYQAVYAYLRIAEVSTKVLAEERRGH